MAKQVIEMPYHMSFSFAAPNVSPKKGTWYFDYYWKHGWFHCQLQLVLQNVLHQTTTWDMMFPRLYKDKDFLLEQVDYGFTTEFRRRWHKAFIAKLKKEQPARRDKTPLRKSIGRTFGKSDRRKR